MAKTERDLPRLGREIARHMPGWRCEIHGEYRTTFLVPDNTARGVHPFRGVVPYIHLRVDHRDRLCVSGAWPTVFDPVRKRYDNVSPRDINEESPSISCGAGRTPDAIAKEILRRFLPEYVRIHALCAERLACNAGNTAKQGAMTLRFAAVIGDGHPSENHASWFASSAYGHVDINSGGESGTLEVRGDCDILLAALEAVKAAGGFIT